MPDETPKSDADSDFARQADQADQGLIAEFWAFLMYYKKWWLLPIIVVLLTVGILVLLSSSAIAPFIYPLF